MSDQTNTPAGQADGNTNNGGEVTVETLQAQIAQLKDGIVKAEEARRADVNAAAARRDKALEDRKKIIEALNSKLPDGKKLDVDNLNLDILSEIGQPKRGKDGEKTFFESDVQKLLKDQTEPLQAKLKETTEYNEQIKTQLQKFVVNESIDKLAAKYNVVDEARPLIVQALARAFTTEVVEGMPRISVDPDGAKALGINPITVGDDNQAKTAMPEEVIAKWVAMNPWAQKGVGGGGGSTGSKPNGLSVKTLTGMSPEQQKAALKNLTPEEKQQLFAEAGLGNKSDDIF